MTDHPASALFRELHGAELSAVTFVRDYLQLWFDGPGINVTNPLTVECGGRSIRSAESGFRDMLCAQIGKKVTETDIRANDAFVVRFSDGSLISVSLKLEDYTSPEAYYAHHFREGGWYVG